MRRICLMTVLLLVSALPGREIHVSLAGNDANDGTSDAPCRSLRHAFARLKPGDRCIVHPGIYYETLDQLPSGEPGNPITIVSAKPHEAILTALERVTNWQRVHGDLWKGSVSRTLPGRNWLFINGKPGFRARWPRRGSRDFLNWDAAQYSPEASGDNTLSSPALPDRPDHYWKGATLWVLGGFRWTSWSVTVDDYDAKNKTLFFSLDDKQIAKSAAIPYHSPKAEQGGIFYLLGGVEEIDQPGEYFVDDATKTIYLQLEPGQTPDSLDIRLQISEFIIHTQDQSVHDLVISGFKTTGGSLAFPKCRNVVFENLRCYYLGYLDGGNTGYSLHSSIGFRFGGDHSMIRDSEIAYSYGRGLILDGSDQAIINCDIHDTDFHGSYESPVKLARSASRILVSHNSIHGTGRDCIQPFGSANILQYNDIYHMGKLCHDLGAIYTCATDGEGTEYHHNFVHDNLSSGIRMGIYLDNFTSNYFIYKNVVWNCGISGINLNLPSQNNFVINNTVCGTNKIWGRWPTDWMYNCAYINNAVEGKLKDHPQLCFQHNLTDIPAEKLLAQKFIAIPEGVGKGFPVAGITGNVPSIGAYAPGETWEAGHDFTRHPLPAYRQWKTLLRSLIRRGAFPGEPPWRAVGTKQIDIQTGAGYIDKSYAERDSVIGKSCALIGKGSGIAQNLTGFEGGQTYELSVWYKSGKAGTPSSLKLAVLEDDKKSVFSAGFPADDTWRQATLRIKIRETTQKLDIQILNQGDGTIWGDDAAFVGILPGIEPKAPGLAAVPQEENLE